MDYIMAGQAETFAQQRQETGFQQASFDIWIYDKPRNTRGQVNVSPDLARQFNLPSLQPIAADHARPVR